MVFKLHVFQKFVSHELQGICGPGLEPIDCTAIDQGREHPQAVPKGVPNWAHG